MRHASALLTLCLSMLSCGGGEPAPPAVKPSAPVVVLVVIDTLRADVVAEVDTPVLDALAASGDSVGRAWAAGTWTVPSTISLMSGAAVRTHGWDAAFPDAKAGAASLPRVPDVPLLAEVLSEGGVNTQGRFANPLLGKLGLGRGFSSWEYQRDNQMAAAVRKMVATWAPRQPQFLYLHYLGPHHPLSPTKQAAERHGVKRTKDHPIDIHEVREGGPDAIDRYTRAYKAVVEDADRRLGDALKALGPWREDAVVIVTSDHGELLGEHDRLGHARWVWEPLTHVPLVADGLGELPDTLVTTALASRITAVYGLDHAWPDAGKAPLPLVSQREGKVAFSADGTHKAIWDPESLQDSDGVAVFDLSADPGELAGQPLDPQLAAARQAWEAATPAGPAALQADKEGGDLDEMLRELGYMDGSD